MSLLFVTIRSVALRENMQCSVKIFNNIPYEFLIMDKIKNFATTKEGIKTMNKIKNTEYLLGLCQNAFLSLYPQGSNKNDEVYWSTYSTYELCKFLNIAGCEDWVTRYELICYLKFHNS